MTISSNVVLKQENSSFLNLHKKPKKNRIYNNLKFGIEDLLIPGRAKKLLTFLTGTVNLTNSHTLKHPPLFPGLKYMGAHTGLSRSTIQRAKKDLVSYGLIKLSQRWNKKGDRTSDQIFFTPALMKLINKWLLPSAEMAARHKREMAKNPVGRLKFSQEYCDTTLDRILTPYLVSTSYRVKSNIITTGYIVTPVGLSTGAASSDKNLISDSDNPFGQASDNSQPQSGIAHEPKERESIPHCPSEDLKPAQCHYEDRPPNKLKELFDRLKKACPQAKGSLDHFWYLKEFHGWKISRIEGKIQEIENYPEIARQVYGVGVVFTMVNRASRIYKTSGIYPPDRRPQVKPETAHIPEYFAQSEQYKPWFIGPKAFQPEYEPDFPDSELWNCPDI